MQWHDYWTFLMLRENSVSLWVLSAFHLEIMLFPLILIKQQQLIHCWIIWEYVITIIFSIYAMIKMRSCCFFIWTNTLIAIHPFWIKSLQIPLLVLERSAIWRYNGMVKRGQWSITLQFLIGVLLNQPWENSI